MTSHVPSPRISVLVAAYNASTTLPCCLDSLLQQTLQEVEVLCVDDCSTDGTLHILKDYAARDARVTVLSTPVNSGQAVARNIALEHVHAPLVCMVDADDWLSPDALESAWHIFQEHPQTDCCVFRLMEHYEDGHERDYGLPPSLSQNNAISGLEALELSLDAWKIHGLYVTRTSLHQRFPFDTTTRLYSDDNTSRIHFLHSRKVRACQGIYYYRKHSSSMTMAFSIHRFDFMEANLSLLLSLKDASLPLPLLRRYEGSRWMTFIACYRLYLEHRAVLSSADIHTLLPRFRTILHTFRPSRLPLRYRWKPGYWLTLNVRFFDVQQKAYLRLWQHGIKKLLKKK